MLRFFKAGQRFGKVRDSGGARCNRCGQLVSWYENRNTGSRRAVVHQANRVSLEEPGTGYCIGSGEAVIWTGSRR